MTVRHPHFGLWAAQRGALAAPPNGHRVNATAMQKKICSQTTVGGVGYRPCWAGAWLLTGIDRNSPAHGTRPARRASTRTRVGTGLAWHDGQRPGLVLARDSAHADGHPARRTIAHRSPFMGIDARENRRIHDAHTGHGPDESARSLCGVPVMPDESARPLCGVPVMPDESARPLCGVPVGVSRVPCGTSPGQCPSCRASPVRNESRSMPVVPGESRAGTSPGRCSSAAKPRPNIRL